MRFPFDGACVIWFFWVACTLFASVRREDGMPLLFLRTSVRKTILIPFLCSCGVPGCPFGLRLDLIVFFNSNFLGPGIFQLAWRNGNERKGNKRALMEMKGKNNENGPLWLITLRGQPPLCATPLLMTCVNALPSKMSVVPNMSQELPVHGQLRVKKTHVYRRFSFLVKMACTFSFHDVFHKSQHVWSHFLWYTRRCRVWDERWHLFYVFQLSANFWPKTCFLLMISEAPSCCCCERSKCFCALLLCVIY